MGDADGTASLLSTLKAALAGRYEVERELGSGGMSVVFLARDLKNPRAVAIKVLKPDLVLSSGYDRFLQEIQITTRLSHPHILPMLYSGQVGDLLFYVMPFVEGESLQQRLRREKQLPLEDAIRITQEVAEVMIVAHREGLVHRDLKPANILLHGGHAIVADFGIAKALAGGTKVTITGTAVGTPGYMSLEQAGGGDVDARSDVYSLGCVLYEMLAGETPYTGNSAEAILRKQVSLPVPSIRVQRDTVPVPLEDVLFKALAKVPADRFSSMEELVSALDHARDSRPLPPPVPPQPPRRPKKLVFALGVVAVAVSVGAWALVSNALDRAGGDPASLDTTRYAILLFEDHTGGRAGLDVERRLHDALAWWKGITVVNPFEVRAALPAGGGTLTPARAARAARQLNAGRFLRGTVSFVGDSLRVHGVLYDGNAQGAALADIAQRLPRDSGESDSAFRVLVDGLLFGGVSLGDTARRGTRSLPARQAFAKGQGDVEVWDLSAAEKAFSTAESLDPEYAEAHLWVAIVRAWNRKDRSAWSLPAQQARLSRGKLSARDGVMADAMFASAGDDLGTSCRSWDHLTTTSRADPIAWHGLAHCLLHDGAVIKDGDSPTGWSFRSSYRRAYQAYQRAFQLRPAILEALRVGAHTSLRRLLMVDGTARRLGAGIPPDTTTFVADPAWRGDSLSLVPYPRHDPESRRQVLSPPAQRREALRNQREMFRRIAENWIASFPESAHALEALAVSLALLGDPAALDTLRHARRLVRDPSERMQLAAADVWMQVSLAIPTRPQDLVQARELADSLLRDNPPGGASNPILLAGLAALTGRTHLTAEYYAQQTAEELDLPVPVRDAAARLIVYAALGGPVDSLRSLERRVLKGLDRVVLPVERNSVMDRWLSRGATLTFHTYQFESLPQLIGRDYVLNIQVAWVAGDRGGTRDSLEATRVRRRHFVPSELALDALYPEAELWVRLGDLQVAARWLDPTLESLSEVSPAVLGSPVRAASLVRAMALRAAIARDLDDRGGAARWADAVTILWSHADAHLQTVVHALAPLRTK